jgi:hypothetical protein
MELENRKLALLNISSQHPRFKVYRRLIHTSMNPRAVERYNVILDEERHILLRALATEPEAFLRHIRRYVPKHGLSIEVNENPRRVSGGTIMKVTYGWTVKGTNDYFVSLTERSSALLVEILTPGRWLVDVFPIREPYLFYLLRMISSS